MGNFLWKKNNFTAAEKELFRKQSIAEKKYDVIEWNEDQRKRLTRLMRGDNHEDTLVECEIDKNTIVITSFDHQYGLFLKAYPEWGKSEAVVFINNYSSLPNLKVLRRQMRESGLCFMHAPVVLQHYLVSIYKARKQETNNMEMIDVAKYIATIWKDEKLLNYLLNDMGGSSLEFLKEINFHVKKFKSDTRSLPDPEDENAEFRRVCEQFKLKLKDVPALISNFEVDKHFAFIYSGVSFLTSEIDQPKDPSKRNGHHAMVLLGIRQCPVHEYVFLLQNWWRGDATKELGRFFIEVSARYMFQAGAQVTFVNSEIPEIPTNFPKVYKPYVETSADSSERMYEVNVISRCDVIRQENDRLAT